MDIDTILKTIVFEEVEPVPGERLGLHRISSEKGCIDVVRLFEGTEYKPHIHEKVDATFFMLAGDGLLFLDGIRHRYQPEDSFYVPRGTAHGFQVEKETFFLSIQSSPIRDDAGNYDFRLA